MSGTPPLLEVRDLTVRFPTRSGVVHAVDGVSFGLQAGESLGLVGESGAGKSVTALAILGLLPAPGRVVDGSVRLRGRDLAGLDARGWRGVRGREIAMVFQDPATSLNPVLPVGRQVTEVLEAHTSLRGRVARAEAERLLARVGIPDAGRRLDDHPHQFSGGQRQRIHLAAALAGRPALLIADEPTTALDVTVQAQIVALVRELRREMGMAVLWITHDLALVAGVVDRVAVLYAGRIVEEAPAAALFARPAHPYTRALLASMPALDGPEPSGRLAAIEGRPPDLLVPPESDPPAHCAFAPRCPHAADLCWVEAPPLQPVPGGGEDGAHRAACWFPRSGDGADPEGDADAGEDPW
ncbi:MAG: ABC transporter ATP-binding protein [Longimicrobiales bacterium]|nr:ABC transporter ATP-binding protein [Longimicrobiales bacterium]